MSQSTTQQVERHQFPADASEFPRHGDHGVRHTSITDSDTCRSTVSGTERWCATCREWVYPRSIVTLVLGSVACHKCKTPWESPHFTGPRTGTRHGYRWMLSHRPEAIAAKYAADILDPNDNPLDRVFGSSEERCRETAIIDIERRHRETVALQEPFEGACESDA